MNTPGERLRALRESRNLTQADLSGQLAAAGMKYSQARISRLERGWIAPTSALMACLAHVLNVEVEELNPAADQRLHWSEARELIELEASELVWLMDHLSPSKRAILQARLKAKEPRTRIAVSIGY